MPADESTGQQVPPAGEDFGITHAMPPMNVTPDLEEQSQFYDVAPGVHPTNRIRCAALNVGREVSAAVGRTALSFNGQSDPSNVKTTACIFAKDLPAGAYYPNQVVVSFVPDGQSALKTNLQQSPTYQRLDGNGERYWTEYSANGGTGLSVMVLDGDDLVLAYTLNYNDAGALTPPRDQLVAIAEKVLSMRWAPGHIG